MSRTQRPVDDRPLVVTLELDDATTARFDDERRRLFPPGRTAVGAHLTLFHTVPGDLAGQVAADVGRVTERPPFDVEVTGVRRLSGGAAYDLRAAEAEDLHGTLQRAWRDRLTPQDRQPFKAHVTVQNKAEKAVAERTVSDLRAAFAPFTARAEAVAVWRYAGGPWEPAGRYPLGGAAEV